MVNVRFRPIAVISRVWKHLRMGLLLFALIATVQPAPSPKPAAIGRTARIFATVGHSEFCPAGNVTVDLPTGNYQATARADQRVCNQEGLERPSRKGKLSAQNLEDLRAAYIRALSEGLESRTCRQPGQDIIISNGGTPLMALTTGSFTVSVPNDLSCWSEAATALYDTLDQLFSPDDYR